MDLIEVLCHGHFFVVKPIGFNSVINLFIYTKTECTGFPHLSNIMHSVSMCDGTAVVLATGCHLQVASW